MPDTYEYARSTGEKPLRLLFYPDTFETLPFEIRLLGPWFGRAFGDVVGLPSARRRELAQNGYTIVTGPPNRNQDCHRAIAGSSGEFIRRIPDLAAADGNLSRQDNWPYF